MGALSTPAHSSVQKSRRTSGILLSLRIGLRESGQPVIHRDGIRSHVITLHCFHNADEVCWPAAGLKMFGFGSATRIYLAAGATDMRQGFEGLYGLARGRLMCDPLSGHVFLFSNAQRNRLKLLFWDGTGLWICSKRLEKGRFRWPETLDGETKVVLSCEELALLLGGIDLAQTRRRSCYRKLNPDSQRLT